MYATGSFQNLVAETIGIDQSTASRTIHRVTNVLVYRMHDWVRLPTQQEADQQCVFVRACVRACVPACVHLVWNMAEISHSSTHTWVKYFLLHSNIFMGNSIYNVFKDSNY